MKAHPAEKRSASSVRRNELTEPGGQSWRPGYLTPYRLAAAHDQRVIVERPDGSRVCVLVNIDPLYDENGVLVGAVNCFQDISDVTGLDTIKSPSP